MKHTSMPTSARIVIHASALLIAAFTSLAAAAQSTQPVVRIGDNWAVSGPASSRQGMPGQAIMVDKALPQVLRTLKDIEPGASRAWKDNMVVRENAEDYNCLLSFGIGGELKAGGYAGTRLFGRTLTLNGDRSK